MTKIWFLILASLFLSACGMAKLIPSNGATEAKQKIGDMVVAKWAVGSFYEGKIDKIDGSKITVRRVSTAYRCLKLSSVDKGIEAYFSTQS